MTGEFDRLRQIFHQVNTHLTFLASHSRSTIPTFELLHRLNEDIEKVDLAIFYHLLPAGDVTYQYVDENQVSLLLKEKVTYNWKTGYKQNKNDAVDAAYEVVSKHEKITEISDCNNDNVIPSSQLLIFDFKDVKTHGIGPIMMFPKRRKPNKSDNDRGEGFFLSCQDLSVKNLTNQQIISIIVARDKKFNNCLKAFIDDCRSNDLDISDENLYQSLVSISESKIPTKIEMVDPMLEEQSSILDISKPSLDTMIKTLKNAPFYNKLIIHSNLLTQSSDPVFEKLDMDIHPSLITALENYKGISIDNFYTHQSQALQAINKGSHVIVSTSTSSGKSLIYQIPILNDILWDASKKRRNTALFIFPTKALAQDQKRHLEELIEYIPFDRKIVVDTFDGDTPQNRRRTIRQTADIIFTNPDALHAAILPNYNKVQDDGWIEVLGNLRYIALDEIHVYKGTFGVHVSYILRRLNRMVNELSGTLPQYISCSATILDPDKHFRILCGLKDQDIIHISQDGSPKGNKMFLIWQPPPVMNKSGKTIDETLDRFVPRVLIIAELARLLLHIISKHPSIKVIVFCTIRKICELLMREIRLLLPEYSNVSEGDIMSYRGGYLKEDRRKIEQQMFSGNLKAIVATNALELGIDLSELDVVISCGYPMLKANMHQQFGRAGRSKNSNSLAIYVCGATAVDQYFISHPEELHGKDYEDLCIEGMIELLQMLVMEMHLQCAAFELPISLTEDMHWFVDQKSLENAFVKACRDNLILMDGVYRTSPAYLPWPAELVSIRAVEEDTFAVVDITNGKSNIIEEVEALRTSFTLYEGGIFLHQGLPYLVKEFNTKEHFAKVERVKVEWLTQQRDFTDMEPQEIEFIKCLHVPGRRKLDIPVFYGKIEITTIVFGYFKVNRRGEILEAVEVDNPPVKIKSKGFWIDIPRRAINLIRDKNLSPAAGIHAAQHSIINILPLFISGGATTNPNVRFNLSLGEAELRTECKAPQKEFARLETSRKRPPRLIFHDSKGGERGTGMSAKTFEHIDKIIWTAYERIKECPCEWGCPACVHATFCKEMLLVILKPAALIILGAFVGFDNDYLDANIRDGPEENLPDITIETIDDTPAFVKMAPDVQVISQRIINSPTPEIKREDNEVNDDNDYNTIYENDNESDDRIKVKLEPE